MHKDSLLGFLIKEPKSAPEKCFLWPFCIYLILLSHFPFSTLILVWSLVTKLFPRYSLIPRIKFSKSPWTLGYFQFENGQNFLLRDKIPSFLRLQQQKAPCGSQRRRSLFWSCWNAIRLFTIWLRHNKCSLVTTLSSCNILTSHDNATCLRVILRGMWTFWTFWVTTAVIIITCPRLDGTFHHMTDPHPPDRLKVSLVGVLQKGWWLNEGLPNEQSEKQKNVLSFS